MGTRWTHRYNSKGERTGYSITRTSHRASKAERQAVATFIVIGSGLIAILMILGGAYQLLTWADDWRAYTYPGKLFALNLWLLGKALQLVFGGMWDVICTQRLTPFPVINVVFYLIALATVVGAPAYLLVAYARKSARHMVLVKVGTVLVLFGPALLALLWWLVALIFTRY